MPSTQLSLKPAALGASNYRMEYFLRTGTSRWVAWTCVLVLLVAGCAGAIHICNIGLGSLTDRYSSFDIGASHEFCVICALAHSSWLAITQVSLPYSLSFSLGAVPAPIIHAFASTTFGLFIRPPPAC